MTMVIAWLITGRVMGEDSTPRRDSELLLRRRLHPPTLTKNLQRWLIGGGASECAAAAPRNGIAPARHLFMLSTGCVIQMRSKPGRANLVFVPRSVVVALSRRGRAPLARLWITPPTGYSESIPCEE